MSNTQYLVINKTDTVPVLFGGFGLAGEKGDTQIIICIFFPLLNPEPCTY